MLCSPPCSVFLPPMSSFPPSKVSCSSEPSFCCIIIIIHPSTASCTYSIPMAILPYPNFLHWPLACTYPPEQYVYPLLRSYNWLHPQIQAASTPCCCCCCCCCCTAACVASKSRPATAASALGEASQPAGPNQPVSGHVSRSWLSARYVITVY